MRQTQWERASPPVGLSHADGFDGLSQLARRDAPDFDLILASARRSWIHQPALFSRVNLRLARRVVPGHGGAWAFQPLSGPPKSRSNRANPIRLIIGGRFADVRRRYTPAGSTKGALGSRERSSGLAGRAFGAGSASRPSSQAGRNAPSHAATRPSCWNQPPRCSGRLSAPGRVKRSAPRWVQRHIM
jgi:hypothetical protein